MMKVLVTGCAGFIGSHVSEALVKKGDEVIGIDCFTDYYPRKIKEKNIANLTKKQNFRFIEGNILKLDLKDLLKNINCIIHEAAQAGVRASWGQSFRIYVDNNILATQKLLEAAKNSEIKKFVYASSSSVYGDVNTLPMKETDKPKPVSPYGVSKLAGEYLCYLYWKNFNLPTISLRYFTVYGERQRPDMAFHRFIKAILENKKITMYGDGNQTRDFTYISDIVNATISAAESSISGEVFNIGGGIRTSLAEIICLLEKLIGKKAKTEYVKKQMGDVKHTLADIRKAKNILDYKPTMKIEEGLKKEIEWIKKQ